MKSVRFALALCPVLAFASPSAAGVPAIRLPVPAALSTTPAEGNMSSTIMNVAPSATFISSSEAPAPVQPTLTPSGAPIPAAEVTATKTQGPEEARISFEELHDRASLVMMPSAYAAHVGRETGENARAILAWYIGTLYNEEGLFIAPIFSLFAGVDAKWSFIRERRTWPATALGYYGGLTMPFTGGAIRTSMALKASSTEGEQEDQLKQAWLNNLYGVMSKRFGRFAFSWGGIYGLKKALPRIYPMLRNSSYSTTPNPASDLKWTAFGGVDFSWRKGHIKLEVVTLPETIEPAYDDDAAVRPWLIQSHIDGFLGFDLGYLRDRIGYEVIGYYMLPLMRWPNKKRLEKEVERAQARKTGAISAP